MDDTFSATVSRLRQNVFVDRSEIDVIVRASEGGHIGEAEALSQLLALEHNAELGPFVISRQEADRSWAELLGAMTVEGAEWQKIAKWQYYQGFAVLPVGAVLILAGAALIAWLSPAKILIASPILAGCLGALGLHAFLVLRVHQQARVAAERMSEKRAAILFLRLAVGRGSPAEVALLLSAGTAMFLGHQASAAAPLQPEDYRGR